MDFVVMKEKVVNSRSFLTSNNCLYFGLTCIDLLEIVGMLLTVGIPFH